ncbi:hypothetical protein [Amycolatopsis orientalis]|uniref:hypothetical protein n=1 Tax=Amycolatopsis orientalis TaxID=31958 RepID=UPI00039D28CA|nr:hypothetical protein [Amycolatopsis orientalis]
MPKSSVLSIAAAIAAVAALAACSPGTAAAPAESAAARPEPFGAAGYRGVAPGMAKEAALATGKLAGAPVSALDGCTVLSWQGGPAPDPAKLAAEAEAQRKADDLYAKSDAADKAAKHSTGTSAAELAKAAAQDAEAAQLAADSAMASADLAGKREERDKAFAAAGGASFGKNGLHALGAPPDAKTAEGIGIGSSLADLHKAYDARGLKLGAAGRFELPIAEKPGWRFEFTPADNGTVRGVAITDGAPKCR